MKALIAILIILLSSIASAEDIYEIDRLPLSAYERIFESPTVCVENPIYDAYDNICAICILPGMAIVRTTDITPQTRKQKLYEVIFSLQGKSYRLRCGEKLDRNNLQVK
jgi:hypothetical protein